MSLSSVSRMLPDFLCRQYGHLCIKAGVFLLPQLECLLLLTCAGQNHYANKILHRTSENQYLCLVCNFFQRVQLFTSKYKFKLVMFFFFLFSILLLRFWHNYSIFSFLSYPKHSLYPPSSPSHHVLSVTNYFCMCIGMHTHMHVYIHVCTYILITLTSIIRLSKLTSIPSLLKTVIENRWNCFYSLNLSLIIKL